MIRSAPHRHTTTLDRPAAPSKSDPAPRSRRAVPVPQPSRESLLSEREDDLLLGLVRSRSPLTSSWNVPLWRRLRGTLDVDALEAALSLLQERHEPLRAAYRRRGVTFSRSIQAPLPVRLERTSLAGIRMAERVREAELLAWDDLGTAFDLTTPPLLKARLVTLAPNDHVLLLTVHHLAADRWSLGVLVRELWAAYTAILEGRSPELDPLPLPYFDYVAWRREDRQGIFRAHRAYWKAQLAGAAPLQRFGPPLADTAGKPARDRGVLRAHELPQATCDALRGVCEEQRVSMFMLLLAAYQALLSRYSGATDVLVDCQTANRMRRELRDVVGCLVNRLRLRTDLSGDPPFTDLLDRVRGTVVEGLAYQELEADMYSSAESDRKVPDAVKIRFAYRSALEMRLLESALSTRVLTMAPFGDIPHVDSGDLALLVTEPPSPSGTLSCSIAYRPSMFPRSMVAGFADHFAQLLAGIGDRPGARLSELPILTAAETRLLDPPVVPAPAKPCLAAVEESLRRHGERVAVVCGAASITYAELDVRSRNVRADLQRRRTGRGALVAVEPGGGAEQAAVLMLGALRAGAAFVVVDGQGERDELRSLLDSLDIAGVLTPQPCAAAERVSRVSVDDEDLAYVIAERTAQGAWLTPTVTHGALHHLPFLGPQHVLRSSDVVAVGAPLHSEAFIAALLGSVARGARLIVLPHDRRAVSDIVAGERITVALLAPGYAAHLDAARAELEKTLRLVAVVGDAWPDSAPRPARGASVLVRGPGHGAILSCAHGYDGAGGEDRGCTTPFIRGRHYILDAHDNLVPRGLTGELFIGGPAIPCGYRTTPAAHARDFIAHPGPAGGDGRLLFRTGHRARLLDDDRVELVEADAVQPPARGSGLPGIRWLRRSGRR